LKKLATRDAYGKKLIELGYKIPNLVVLDADLSNSTKTSYFQREFRERHFNLGIAENNMLLFASGLAIAGNTVFASSFAIFETGRTWEIIRNTIAHDKLDVKIVATHAGISVGEDGYSHQANEDLAIMRVIPNMTVLCPADAIETEKMIEYIAFNKGPVYVRLSRETSPMFINRDEPYQFGKGQILHEGKAATIIAIGMMVYPALTAAKKLAEEGIAVRVVNMSCLKPIDEEIIVDSAKNTPFIITCEEHSIVGGLGSAVSEVVAEKYPAKVIRMGIRDVFGQSGTPDELFKFYELTAEDIIKKVKQNS